MIVKWSSHSCFLSGQPPRSIGGYSIDRDDLDPHGIGVDHVSVKPGDGSQCIDVVFLHSKMHIDVESCRVCGRIAQPATFRRRQAKLQ